MYVLDPHFELELSLLLSTVGTIFKNWDDIVSCNSCKGERTDTDLPGPWARARAQPGPATPRACLTRSVTNKHTSLLIRLV